MRAKLSGAPDPPTTSMVTAPKKVVQMSNVGPAGAFQAVDPKVGNTMNARLFGIALAVVTIAWVTALIAAAVWAVSLLL
jgi:uncharacterized membrane protein